ncbi:MAG: DEAD/DEAH box helicase family protein, partial [Lentisphaerae bacterium]|nr:DEAD/DEAH box helicase family protein [Lentisphaerota bacterium]
MGNIAKIVVDISLDREFDYLVPEAIRDKVKLGSRVNVPFGNSFSTGYVVGFKDSSDWPNLKAIKSVVGDKPLLDADMISLARWISAYYVSTFEQSIKTLLPCAVRKRGAKFKIQQVARLLGTGSGKEPPAKITEKQMTVLKILEESVAVPVIELARRAEISVSTIKTMQKKNLLDIREENIERDPFASDNILRTEPLKLFPEQASALELINKAIASTSPKPVLLHGVTGSGKTEVYLQAIQSALNCGKGAIVLVPEISLT